MTVAAVRYRGIKVWLVGDAVWIVLGRIGFFILRVG